jgi:hypothetical protein
MFAGVVGDARTSLLEIAHERRALDAAEAKWLAAVAEYDRSGEWRADGFESVSAALRSACNLSSGVALDHVQLARKLESLPVVAASFQAGEISRAHAKVIASAYTPERAEALNQIEPHLVEVARFTHPRQLGHIVRRYAEAIDGDGGASADEIAYQRRRLHLGETLDGVGIMEGVTEPLGHEIIVSALDAEMERDLQAGDTRTRPQRRYDALVNLCRRALDTGSVGRRRRAFPHVSIVANAEQHGTAPLVPTAEGSHVGPISHAMLELILCDCTVARVLMQGKSEVLDVGRATRVVPLGIWNAVVARDRHCTAPGCERPPGDCQPHHIHHWTRGGETKVENLRLLCWHHHRDAHFHRRE